MSLIKFNYIPKSDNKELYNNLELKIGENNLKLIKQNYNKLLKINHPDKGGTQEKMESIKQAFEILNEPGLKFLYDNFGDSTFKFVKINKKYHYLIYYKWAYVWPMKFKAGQTIKVVNKYRQGITADSSGHILPNYILMTGGMWKGGKIGRSRIDILGDDDAIPCGPNDGQITPPGSRLDKTDAGPALRWDLKDFAPKTDVEGCFLSRSQSRMMEFSGLQGTDLKGLTAAELRVLRNTVFALHGYTFKDADLQKHFEKQRYYYPRKSFKQSDLSKEEREFVNLVLAQEKALKKK
jgi:hypothetical protein